jgi:hypothetical protein
MPQNTASLTARTPSKALAFVNLDADGNLLVAEAGAGGSAVTVADGADVAQGAKADVAWASGSGSVIALLKNIAGALAGSLKITAASFLNNSAGSAGVAVKAGAGTLFGLSINTAGTASSASLYDSPTTTANLIGTFDTTAQGGPVLPAGGIAFTTGLWLVATTGAGAANITVSYK